MAHNSCILLSVSAERCLLVEKQMPWQKKKKKHKHKVLNFSVRAKKCGLRPDKNGKFTFCVFELARMLLFFVILHAVILQNIQNERFCSNISLKSYNIEEGFSFQTLLIFKMKKKTALYASMSVMQLSRKKQKLRSFL